MQWESYQTGTEIALSWDSQIRISAMKLQLSPDCGSIASKTQKPPGSKSNKCQRQNPCGSVPCGFRSKSPFLLRSRSLNRKPFRAPLDCRAHVLGLLSVRQAPFSETLSPLCSTRFFVSTIPGLRRLALSLPSGKCREPFARASSVECFLI